MIESDKTHEETEPLYQYKVWVDTRTDKEASADRKVLTFRTLERRYLSNNLYVHTHAHVCIHQCLYMYIHTRAQREREGEKEREMER